MAAVFGRIGAAVSTFFQRHPKFSNACTGQMLSEFDIQLVVLEFMFFQVSVYSALAT